MIRNMNLRYKLIIAFLTVSVIPLGILAAISLSTSGSALSDQAFAHLKSLRELKKERIEHFFEDQGNQTEQLIETVRILRQNALRTFSSVQEAQKAQVEEYFRKCQNELTVISGNETVVSALIRFGNAVDSEGKIDRGRYDYYEDEFGNSLKKFKDIFGYYDLLLINKSGTAVYSTVRESDLGKNLADAALKNSGLGKCFQKGMNGFAIQDFEPYNPSGNRYVLFAGASIVFEKEIVGMVAAKITQDAVNTIIQRRKGMGDTGETYLVGRSDDGKTGYRSDRIVKPGKIGDAVQSVYIVCDEAGVIRM